MTKPNTITIEQAVNALANAAQKDLPAVQARLLAAGFEVVAYRPLQGTPNLDVSAASDIGAVIEGRGIYHGAWQPRPNGAIVHAYSDTDLLKDASGEQLLLTWYAARDELARRNNGRSYGDGTETALCNALAKPSGTQGAYRDGNLVMGPQVLLNGVDNGGEKVRAQNTFDLLSASRSDAFKTIVETLRNTRSVHSRWSWSCSEAHGNTSSVMAVSISAGGVDCLLKDFIRLGVLPFRFFRQPHAVKGVSRLNI